MSVRVLHRGKGQVAKEPIAQDLNKNLSWLKEYLGYKVSFDFIIREFKIHGRRAALVYYDSFVDSTVLTLIMEELMKSSASQTDSTASVKQLLNDKIPYVEVSTETELVKTTHQILSGPVALLVDGDQQAIIMDVRQYPTRSIEEPSTERSLQGPHDGFVETLIFNVVLIRRRLRDPNLRFEAMQVGRRSKTDLAVAYMADVADPKLVKEVKRRIQDIKIDAITMSEKAVEEWIIRKPWWNPWPVARFTERPDVAAEHISEGHVLVLVDTSPNAIVVPVTLFSFLQSIEEYHEQRLGGTYLKWVRFLSMAFSWVGVPLWYALYLSHPSQPALQSLFKPQVTTIPLFWQIIAAEIGIDMLRLALTFSPDPLTQSMGFLGAVLLGSLIVNAKLLDALVVILVAVAAVGSYATPDLDFGLSVRLFRLFTLVLTGLAAIAHMPWVGFAVALLWVAVMAARTESFGVPYLWPLAPWNGSALLSQLIRKSLTAKVMRPAITNPQDPTHQRPPSHRRRAEGE